MRRIIAVIIFIALHITSCKSDTNQVKSLSEKCVTFMQCNDANNVTKTGETMMKVTNYNIPEVTGNECEVTANVENNTLQPTSRDKKGVIYLKLKKYAQKGWGVYAFDIKSGDEISKQPEWSNFPVPLTEKTLDTLMNKCGTFKISNLQ